MAPPITRIAQDNSHRLIPARYSERGESVFVRLSSDKRHLRDLFELEGATNDRLLGEANLLPGITVHELVFGIPYWHIVNAAFTHTRPSGSRFNGPDRGAWYAGFTLETSQAEVAFHFAEGLREFRWQEEETATFREYQADFRAEFHDIRRPIQNDAQYARYLAPDSYQASQQLARKLLDQGSAGVVYPSVRHVGGTCIACFRPALVTNVRKGCVVRMTFPSAFVAPAIQVETERAEE